MRLRHVLLNVMLFCYFHSLAQVKEAPNLYGVDTIILKQNVVYPDTHKNICLWGDTSFMELHSNHHIFQFKKGLPNGIYIAFFDKTLRDTALLVLIENGKINGLLKRWSETYKNLAEECEYKNGKMNGWRKLYCYTPEGIKQINVELWENNINIKTVQTEW